MEEERLAERIVNADRASFRKWDRRIHTLRTTAAGDTDKIVIPENTGLVGKALAEKKTIITNDPYNCPDFNSDNFERIVRKHKEDILIFPNKFWNEEDILKLIGEQ